jgi:hypothetical protein
MGFFELETPERMLEKAKREFVRLEAEDSIDHVYNFFVTAYHIVDYLDGRLAKPIVKAIKTDPLIMLCEDACNKAKHMELTHRRPDVKTPTIYSVSLGGPPDPANESLERRIVWPSGDSEEVISFARSVIAKWDELFLKHEIGA